MNIRPTEREIQSLIELFENSDWYEFHLKCDGFELFLSKNSDSTGPSSAQASHDSVPTHEEASSPPFIPDSRPADPVAVSAENSPPSNRLAIRAPNLGTFYSAPETGAQPFVSVGDRVDAGSEVCLLQVMKRVTSIPAGKSGVISKICAEDGELVEYGQDLFWVEPD